MSVPPICSSEVGSQPLPAPALGVAATRSDGLAAEKVLSQGTWRFEPAAENKAKGADAASGPRGLRMLSCVSAHVFFMMALCSRDPGASLGAPIPLSWITSN